MDIQRLDELFVRQNLSTYRRTRRFLQDHEVLVNGTRALEASYIIDVRKDRMSLKNNLSARPEHDIHKMLQEIIQSHFYEADYNNVTKKLLYENVSYDEAVENGIAKIVKLGLFEKT